METTDPRHTAIAFCVRLARERVDMSQAGVAKEMSAFFPKWSPALVSQLEAGRRRLLLAEADILAHVLDCSIEELLRGPEEEEPNGRPDLTPWLAQQVDRDDAVGDLARDVMAARRGYRTFERMRQDFDGSASDALDRAEAEWAELT